MERELAKGTELLREKVPQRHFVPHESQMAWPGIESGPQRWEPGDQLPEQCHGHVGRVKGKR
jgi:hypothetical protein